MQTLKQWSDKHGILPTEPTTELHQTSVVCSDGPERRELWHLEDYIVSSVSGVVVWLGKRINW